MTRVTRLMVFALGQTPARDNLGSIHDLMIDKLSGKVAYAIMSFGSFLGIGNS